MQHFAQRKLRKLTGIQTFETPGTHKYDYYSFFVQCRAKAKPRGLELEELKDGAIDIRSAGELNSKRASESTAVRAVTKLRLELVSAQSLINIAIR